MNLIMNIIPITQNKINKNKWLNTKIKYDNTLNLNDILIDMSKNIYLWINNLTEYHLNTNKESFNNNFINMIYNKYLYKSKYLHIDDTYEFNYFELKYLEEINQLYLKCKNISDYYLLNIFNENDNYLHLFEFIYKSLKYNDEYSSSDEEEEYLNYNIEC